MKAALVCVALLATVALSQDSPAPAAAEGPTQEEVTCLARASLTCTLTPTLMNTAEGAPSMVRDGLSMSPFYQSGQCFTRVAGLVSELGDTTAHGFAVHTRGTFPRRMERAWATITIRSTCRMPCRRGDAVYIPPRGPRKHLPRPERDCEFRHAVRWTRHWGGGRTCRGHPPRTGPWAGGAGGRRRRADRSGLRARASVVRTSPCATALCI